MTTSKWNTQVLKSLNINWLILLHSPLSPKHTNDKIFVQLFHIIIRVVERKKRVVEFFKKQERREKHRICSADVQPKNFSWWLGIDIIGRGGSRGRGAELETNNTEANREQKRISLCFFLLCFANFISVIWHHGIIACLKIEYRVPLYWCAHQGQSHRG